MTIENIIKQANEFVYNLNLSDFETVLLTSSEYDYDSDTNIPSKKEFKEKLENCNKKNIIIDADINEFPLASFGKKIIKELNKFDSVIFLKDISIYCSYIVGELNVNLLGTTGQITIGDSKCKSKTLICEKINSFASSLSFKNIFANDAIIELTDIEDAEAGSGTSSERYIHTDNGNVLNSKIFNVKIKTIKGDLKVI